MAIDAKASNMRMSCDQVKASELSALADGRDLLRSKVNEQYWTGLWVEALTVAMSNSSEKIR